MKSYFRVACNGYNDHSFKVNTPVIDKITGHENTKGVETINNRAKNSYK